MPIHFQYVLSACFLSEVVLTVMLEKFFLTHVHLEDDRVISLRDVQEVGYSTGSIKSI